VCVCILYPQINKVICDKDEKKLLAAAASDYIIFSWKTKKGSKHKLWMRPNFQEENEKNGLRLKFPKFF